MVRRGLDGSSPSEALCATEVRRVRDALNPMPVAARNPLPVDRNLAPTTGRSLMLGLQLPRSRSAHRPSRPYRYVASLLAPLAVLVVPTVALAANGFTEEVASARWLIS